MHHIIAFQTNYFVLNLAFSDLLMMTGQALPIFFNMVAGEDYWCWGVLGCKLYAVHGAIVGTSSIWTMVVIGFDRCISEYYPLVDFTPNIGYLCLDLI